MPDQQRLRVPPRNIVVHRGHHQQTTSSRSSEPHGRSTLFDPIKRLSNLVDSIERLFTLRGSLYFAAPELLNKAKIYLGLEVDVWSFSVVLYVLVCGKVPFDDYDMPTLRAKIKRGLVEYPVWLSTECKDLLARMLVTNPAARAALVEVMAHPWMVRDFSGPPDPHTLHREPLRADHLDREVIRGMQGFEFGSEDEIERKLEVVLESDAYVRAVQHWESGHTLDGAFSWQSPSHLHDKNSSTHEFPNFSPSLNAPPPESNAPKKLKRLLDLDFYRHRLFPPASSLHETTPSHSLPSQIVDIAQKHDPRDPTRGFHPLVSMYYLAREKRERERLYPGRFTSSQSSIMEKDFSRWYPAGSWDLNVHVIALREPVLPTTPAVFNIAWFESNF